MTQRVEPPAQKAKPQPEGRFLNTEGGAVSPEHGATGHRA